MDITQIEDDKRRLFIIDGNALVSRAFYAIPQNMASSEGIPTNAVYGFFSMLGNFLQQFCPDVIICAFDGGTPEFRKVASQGSYKKQRHTTPDDLIKQFPVIEEILDTIDIPYIRILGWEGDDIIGTLAEIVRPNDNYNVFILSNDQDLFQLVDDKTFIVVPQQGLSVVKVFGPDEVEEKLGVKPSQVADYKSLSGDASDNVKGVSGIGKKRAQSLLNDYNSLEGIYEHLDDISPVWAAKLKEGKDDAFNSKIITTISTNLELEQNDLWHNLFEEYHTNNSMQVIDKLSFPSYNENDFRAIMEYYDFSDRIINNFINATRKNSSEDIKDIETEKDTEEQDEGIKFVGTLFG